MKKYSYRFLLVLAAVLFLTVGFVEREAEARAGSSRSVGSRGTRSYSQPARPTVAPTPRPYTPPPLYRPAPAGGFMRSMAGGIVGGMLGGMLFRSMGFGGGMGHGGMGGSGIGLFEILLIAGIIYLIYRMVKKNRENSAYIDQGGYQQGYAPPPVGYVDHYQPEINEVDAGLAYIRQMDPSFDENRFNDNVMDMFFKIQGAWMNRDLSSVTGIMTDEMRRIFQDDIDKMLAEKRVNRLENIAVRSVEVVEAWQEAGQDYLTALVYANLLDYTTDDATGQVVSGSKTEPVKFEEYWTFTRPVGNNPWRLSAINQK